MQRYWWVNHKQTFRQEIEGEYLWSPKRSRSGARNEFYNNMRRAMPGDLVLSYANGLIQFVGRVTEFAFTAPKPLEFGSAGSYWLNEGWLLPVFWAPVTPPVRPKSLFPMLAQLLPARYSPLNLTSGSGNQGAYLAEVSLELFEAVFVRADVDFDALRTGGSNRLGYEAVNSLLEDVVQQAIERDPTLNHTTKEALIQARRGQGKFRKSVELHERACRLTGITNPALLIASHIKPWRLCETAIERLDGMNGLLLTPDADRLFDRGFITFDDGGSVRVSPRVDDHDLRRLGFESLVWTRSSVADAQTSWKGPGLREDQQQYMNYHRSEIFLSEL